MRVGRILCWSQARPRPRRRLTFPLIAARPSTHARAQDGEREQKATVMRYDARAGALQTVGRAGVTDAKAAFIALALDASGSPWIAYQASQ